MHQLTEQELGARLAQQVLTRGDLSPQQLQALVQDLIGSDLSLRAPLRELTQSPALLRAQPLAGGAVNTAVRDALMAELGGVFQPELTARVEQFLNGYLGLERQWGETGVHGASRLKPEALRRISPQMQKRLQRIDALVEQGYRVEKILGCFPVMRPVNGRLIHPAATGQGSAGGFSPIGFFFPFAICFQIKEWGYFWLISIASLLTAIPVGLASGMYNISEQAAETLFAVIALPVELLIYTYYGFALPRLRYLHAVSEDTPFGIGRSIVLGITLAILADQIGQFLGAAIGGFTYGFIHALVT